MRIIQLGGLGNQMFIYAYYYALKKRGANVQIDASLYNFLKMHNGYELPKVFEVEPADINLSGLYLQWLRFLLHFKPHLLISEEIFEREDNIELPKTPYITGYWQSDLYFKEFSDEIRDLYTFKNISTKNRAVANHMQTINSVSLHIRRGDYLTIPGALNVCSEDYYNKAISIINRKVERPHFFIFSNDTAWSERFAKSLRIEYTIIDHNTGMDSYQDMYLMSQCKHNILANSSFSWWGAYLNCHSDAIRIAPYNWCNGHSAETLETDTPKNWLRI